MKRRQNVLFGIISSALLAGLATVLILIFSALTGARIPGWVVSGLGALIGTVVGYFVYKC